MVDFKKLVKRRPAPDLTDPLKLFESLDRRTSHASLRPSQVQAFEQLRVRRTERDLVLRMPTGSGKSIVGLLHLKAHVPDRVRPGVCLPATTQLVEQVLEEAERLGLPAHAYPGCAPPAASGLPRGAGGTTSSSDVGVATVGDRIVAPICRVLRCSS